VRIRQVETAPVGASIRVNKLDPYTLYHISRINHSSIRYSHQEKKVVTKARVDTIPARKRDPAADPYQR
jgi:hypothetical protein